MLRVQMFAQRRLEHRLKDTLTGRATSQPNWKRRLFATWAIAALVWFGGWLLYIRQTCLAEGPVDAKWCYTNLFSAAMSDRFSIWDYATIVISGAALPVLMLLLGIIVWRGRSAFRP
jgi:hypothetical protein